MSTGNGCQLTLTYAPSVLGSGTLTLNYAYDDDTGAAQTGTFNLPYEATTNDNVTATASPSGQINGVIGMATQNVAVVFTTDDGRLATNLDVTSSLTALPAGWSSGPSTFSCTTVSSGTGCQLNLTFSPQAVAAGTLTLNYSYKNNANQMKTGSVAIPYRATTNDTVVGTPSQSSLAAITGTSTPVTVTFATDDGYPASALAVTAGLSALPTGWSSSATTFSCTTVSDGTLCQLPLVYAPAALDSGTLTLSFSYSNDAGIAKTGTVNIAYRANSDDTVGGTVSPASIDVPVTTSQPVTVTFVTSDAASGERLVGDLGTHLSARRMDGPRELQLRDGEQRHGLSARPDLRAARGGERQLPAGLRLYEQRRHREAGHGDRELHRELSALREGRPRISAGSADSEPRCSCR